ncbi:PREDICTED: prostate androgen-regulated mucin-like protein 1 [Miniopterus natalensis]|uniref:prostate androgen-regulated mucin-like protein 1 n=1 Tax=Miniopterus natalensis TaxID=291302 RepID=UPI0007A6F6A7|nr:PREDICTED: prostate androgen-regulated mucin-like protein 1 [Miniopterus natalensis]
MALSEDNGSVTRERAGTALTLLPPADTVWGEPDPLLGCHSISRRSPASAVLLSLLPLFWDSSGLRVQSAPTSAPASFLEKITSPTPVASWTSSPQSPAAPHTSGKPSSAALPVTVALAQTALPPKNVSIEPTGQEATLTWEGTNAGALSTSREGHLTPTPGEHSPGTPEASVPATGPKSPAEPPALTSPQAPASPPPGLSTAPPPGLPTSPPPGLSTSAPPGLPTSPPPAPSTAPPEVSSVSDNTNHNSTETSTKTTGAPATPESPAQEHSSGRTPTSHTTWELVPMETTPQTTVPAKATCVLVDRETTTASPRVVMREVEHALSSGSIAAITVTVIATVLLVFGVAAYLKIRHSSYGRLLDDHDYGSWGNYNNPLYDDS